MNFETSLGYLKAHIAEAPATSLAVKLIYDGLTSQPDVHLLHTAQVMAVFPDSCSVQDVAAVADMSPAVVQDHLVTLEREWRLLVRNSEGDFRSVAHSSVFPLLSAFVWNSWAGGGFGELCMWPQDASLAVVAAPTTAAS